MSFDWLSYFQQDRRPVYDTIAMDIVQTQAIKTAHNLKPSNRRLYYLLTQILITTNLNIKDCY
jgi:hypothetical protein